MLFKTKEEVTEHISVNVNFELSEIKPSYLVAVRKFIVPAIGRAFFKEIEEAYSGVGPINAKVAELISILQDCLAHYTYFLYMPVNQVQIGSNGITEANHEKATAVRQWVSSDLKKSLLDSGDVFLDSVLEFLEDNQNELVFKTWKDSEYFTLAKDLFINSADELSKWTNVQNSRRTFLALKPFLREAERFFIMSTIGEPYFTELKIEIQERDIAVKNQIVIDLIKPAAAQLGVLQAIPKVMLKVTAEGITIDSYSNGIIKKDPGSENLIGALHRKYEQDGNADLVLVKDYLFSHPDDYPTFKESKIYIDSIPLGDSCKSDWTFINGYGA